MLTQNQFDQVAGQNLYATDGDKIGKVSQLFVDDATGAASWLSVNTGFFGTKETFVPAQDAAFAGDGLTVPFDKDTVKNAPDVETQGQRLTPDDESVLLRYYGYGSADGTYDETAGVASRGQSDGMTLSEEQLNVGTQTVESGTAAIRKNVVTEEQTVTVPVQREEARLVREPVTDADQTGDAVIGEDEQRVTLNEERVVVAKETVPVERVRLEKDTVTDHEQVSETVAREEIDTDPSTLSGRNDTY